uniref:RAP domain-containing protein n=1 Tax=Theileria annulata TaxID=5874 RepID=A0A3B0N9B1_THEAN
MLLARFYLTSVQNCSYSYRNLDKLSLKVYYLQELSRIIQSRNNDTLSHNEILKNKLVYNVDEHTFNKYDITQLTQDVNKSINNLSPSQLLSTAISYTKLHGVGKKEWKRLCYSSLKQIYSNCYNTNAISFSQVAMILYSYASKFTNEMPVTNKLLKACVKSTGSLNERDISMILYYIRRTKCVPKTLNTPQDFKNAQILRSIALCLSKEGGNKLVKMTPMGLVSIVYNFTEIGMIPWSLIYHSCNLIKKKSRYLDSKSIGFHSRSLSKLNIRDKKTLNLFVESLPKRTKIPIPTISSLLYSLAKLKYRPKNCLSPLLDYTQKSIFLFDDRDLALLVYSLGQLGVKNDVLFDSISDFIKKRIDYQSPQHLSMFIRGYSRLGIYDEPLIEIILAKAIELMTGFSITQLVSVLDSLVVLGYFDHSVFSRLLEHFCTFHSEDLPEYSINQLNRIMYSIRLQNPEFILNSPSYITSLFDQYQGVFMIRDLKDSSDSLFRCLKQLNVEYEIGRKVGPYVPDTVIDGNMCIDILSKGSVCPLTGSFLGSVNMTERHMNILGYKYIKIRKEEW